jgi:hypothetical protein
MRYRLLASYQGAPYEAGVGPAESDVVLFAACPPPEELRFEPATGHWRKQVHLAEVQTLHESRPVGMFRGERCIVLDDLTDRLHIAYLGHDAYRAEQLGYWEVDRGVFELIAPRLEVTDIVEQRLAFPYREDSSSQPMPYPAAEFDAVPETGAGPELLSHPAPSALDVLTTAEASGVSVPVVDEPPLPLEAEALRAASAATRREQPVAPVGPVAPAGPAAAQAVTAPPAPAAAPSPAPVGLAVETAPAAPTGQTAQTSPVATALASAAPVAPAAPAAPPAAAPAAMPIPAPTPPNVFDPPALADAPGRPQPVAPAEPVQAALATVAGAGAGAGAAATIAPAPNPTPVPAPDPAPALAPATPAPVRDVTADRPGLLHAPTTEPPPQAPVTVVTPHSGPALPAAGSGPAPEHAPAPGPEHAAGPEHAPGLQIAVPPRRRRAARRRLPTQRIFSDLAAQAAIPASAYAVGEDVDGAMCLMRTDEGFEVFNSAAGSRHEVRLFGDEESAYFYLFGVLVADAVRTGALAPRQ